MLDFPLPSDSVPLKRTPDTENTGQGYVTLNKSALPACISTMTVNPILPFSLMKSETMKLFVDSLLIRDVDYLHI